MKKISILAALGLLAIITGSCNKSLNIQPQGSLSEQILTNEKGLDALLIGTYAALDGVTTGTTQQQPYANDFTNWLYGEVASDDALKGSAVTDQNNMTPIEFWRDLTPSNPYINLVWTSVYEGVSRANKVLKILAQTKGLPQATHDRIEGEAKFLRARYYHLGKRYFNNIPYIDENSTTFIVPNNADIWPKIVADYQDAIKLLPVDPYQIGRAHINAAKAGLAVAYLDQKNYASAKPLLDDIINSGRYILYPNYADNFNPANETKTTDCEAIFQVQASLSDAGNPYNGNIGNDVNGIIQIQGCCGFFQPSQNLVNAFKTDADGLPLLDTYADTDLPSDYGIESTDPFTPTTANLDPRLDYTVGRRGIPFKDWGIYPGKAWVLDQANYGPYRAKKFLSTKAQVAQTAGGFFGASIINYSVYRYADILLMRAEVAVEDNDLPTALKYVNMVRIRARDGAKVTMPDGTPAANYVIQPYPSFPNQDYARKAVRFERRLELALEGNRWYDLVRWGVAQQTINTYFQLEGKKLVIVKANGAYKANYLPIPSTQIELSKDKNGKTTLTQNAGYN